MPVIDHPTISARYPSLSAFKAANRSNGFHFFDADAMRFFGSRIESELIHGRYFVTSETLGEICGELVPRRYTVRIALPNGGTDDVGGFREHETLAAARAAVPAHDWRPPVLVLYRHPTQRVYADCDVAAAFAHFAATTGDTAQHASLIDPDSSRAEQYLREAFRL